MTKRRVARHERAFVKEDADTPEPPLPERPISTAPNRVTPRGAALIAQAIAALKDELTRVTDETAAALIRRDLRYWHSRQASMHVIAPNPAPTYVGFGTCVTIRRGEAESVVTIVGEDEAEPAAGRIAWTAPLAHHWKTPSRRRGRARRRRAAARSLSLRSREHDGGQTCSAIPQRLRSGERS
jgi:transcription elongation GreA/GreB family factor